MSFSAWEFSGWQGAEEDWEPEVPVGFGFHLLSRAIEAVSEWRMATGEASARDDQGSWEIIQDRLQSGSMRSFAYGGYGRFVLPLSPDAWAAGGPADVGLVAEYRGQPDRTYLWYVQVEIDGKDETSIAVLDADDLSSLIKEIKSKRISGTTTTPKSIRNQGGTPPKYANFLVEAFSLLYESKKPPTSEKELLERARLLNTDISERQSAELIQLLWKKLNPG